MIAILLWAQTAGAVPFLSERAASTSTIAYQGRLADSGGNPLTTTVNMTFRLYNAATGGTPLWAEDWTGPNGVQVSDGLFNVMLGSLTSIPQNVIAGNPTLFLGITAGTDDEMSPRVQLGSVPFAVQALTVPDGSITKAKLGADVSFVPPDGSVTTGKIGDGAVTSRKLRPTLRKIVAPATLTLSGINQTLASATISVEVPSSVWLIATCDCYASNGGLTLADIEVDGQSLGQGAIFNGWSANSGGARQSVSNSYVFDLTPGEHIVALKAGLFRGEGSGIAYADHSGFSYLLISQ